MIHTDCHTFDPIFSPPYISPKPLFLPKIVTQSHSVTLSKCPEFLEIFHSKTPNRLEFEKKVPKCRLFCYGFCHWKTPYFFALHTHVCLRGMLPQTRPEAGKFCFLETESSNLGNTFRCKVMKIKFHFYRLNRSNCALYGWISLEGRDDTGYHPPSQTREGIYPTNTLYKSAPCLSKKMPSVSEDVQAEAF